MKNGKAINSGQFTMPRPCGQPWEQMKPISDGRFCEHCATPVIDFTNTDRETISRKLREAGGSVCGRMRSNQLGNLQRNKTSRMLRRFCLAIVLVFGLALFNMPETLANTLEEQRSEFLQSEEDTVKTNLIVIRGTVTDEETGEPLPFVPVFVEGNNGNIGTHTDFDGKYVLNINPDQLPGGQLTLQVRYIGYRSMMITDIPVRPGDTIVQNIALSTEELIIVGVIIEHRDEDPHSGRNSKTIFDDQDDW